ncbi:MAG: hypothetical protein GX625_11235 [Clostridiaceae bacterium]|nr:hypothetical protein [Aminivibrio pyruvatiphilus]NLE25891.1 hypothetical protein [Clostridiaceae bacterium]
MDTKNFSVENEAIIELSKLLNSLPLIPLSERDETFRNPSGVRRQLLTFEWGLQKKKKPIHVGEIFYTVYNEIGKNKILISEIAQSIKRNSDFVKSIGFSYFPSTVEFPEGVILFNLHSFLENRHGFRFSKTCNSCSICGLNPQTAFHLRETARFLDPHLLVLPQDMRPEMRFSGKDFITVCPNCHQVLHQYRPWRSRSQCEQILKTLG